MSTSRRRGRRGAIGAAFAVSATALLGLGALATEAGVWLTVRRNAQSAADAAAYAGLVALRLSGSGAVSAVVTDVAGRNNFQNRGTLSAPGDTTIAHEIGFWPGGNGPFTTTVPSGNRANAVRVSVHQVQRVGLTQLITQSIPIAGGVAIAALEIGGPACTLSIPPPDGGTAQVDGTTVISGSTTVRAPDCVIGSNATGRKSISIQNASAAAATTAAALIAAGECYRCDQTVPAQVPAIRSNAPLFENPYADLDTVTPITNLVSSGPPANRTCQPPQWLDANGNPAQGNNDNQRQANAVIIRLPGTTNPAAPVAICQDIAVGSGQTLQLYSGSTYYFYGAGLSMSATSATITCVDCGAVSPGVTRGLTMVFTGSGSNDVGTVDITGGTVSNLYAPSTGVPVLYNGVLIYRDDLARSSNADQIHIRGNPGSTIFGAIYAPTSGVFVNGTADLNQTPTGAGGCLAIVAGSITFSGNSDVTVNACDDYGVDTSRAIFVRLVQ